VYNNTCLIQGLKALQQSEKEEPSQGENEIELQPIILDEAIIKQFRDDLKLPETEEIIAGSQETIQTINIS